MRARDQEKKREGRRARLSLQKREELGLFWLFGLENSETARKRKKLKTCRFAPEIRPTKFKEELDGINSTISNASIKWKTARRKRGRRLGVRS